MVVRRPHYQQRGIAPYDAVVFEREHNPYDIRASRDSMQYMLNHRQIVEGATIAGNGPALRQINIGRKTNPIPHRHHFGHGAPTRS